MVRDGFRRESNRGCGVRTADGPRLAGKCEQNEYQRPMSSV